MSAMNVGPFQLVDGDGEFNYSGVTHFMNVTKMDKCGLNYSVVSILGPKISGKSTLLNHLFGVNFKNDLGGSSPADKGIWLAKSTSMAIFTVVMDLQGIIGKDGTSLEKESIIFALAVSDIVIINLWSNDVETKNATITLLLSTIFQAMLHLSSQRKVKMKLLFVIRDATNTPSKNFQNILGAYVHKIWDSIVKPTKETHPPIEFVNATVATLQSYRQEEELYERQIATLRTLCYSIIYGQLNGDRQGVDPALTFSSITRGIWKTIKDDKDLKFHNFKSMIFTECVQRIVAEKLNSFCNDEEWLNIKRFATGEIVKIFAKEVSKIVNKHLTDYEAKVCSFDTSFRAKGRENLKSSFIMEIQITYINVLRYIRDEIVTEFRNNFAKNIEEQTEEEYTNFAIRSSQDCITEFQTKCEGVVIEELQLNPSIVGDELYGFIHGHIVLVCKQKEVRNVEDRLFTSNFMHGLANFHAKVMGLIATLFGNDT